MNFLVPIHPHLNLLHHWKTILVWSGQILKSKKKTREIKIYTVKIQRENKIFRNGSTGERSISKITSLSPLPSTHLSPCYTVLGTINWILKYPVKVSGLNNRFSVIMYIPMIRHWWLISVTIESILSSAGLTNVGPKTIAKFRTSILFVSQCSITCTKCWHKCRSVSKFSSGKIRIFRLMAFKRLLIQSSIFEASIKSLYNWGKN